MNSEYKVLNQLEQIDLQMWQDFIAQHPQGHYFQSYPAYRLFLETRNYTPVISIVADHQNRICGILLAVLQQESKGIKGFFSSRVIVWGGPLIALSGQDGSTEKENQIAGLLIDDLICQVKKSSIYIQFRNLEDMKKYQPLFQSKGFQYTPHLNYRVVTDSQTETEKRVSKSKMRQIRKSLKSGAKIIEAENLQQVNDFYQLLQELYKTKVKRPLPDWTFFKNFLDSLQIDIVKSSCGDPGGGILPHLIARPGESSTCESSNQALIESSSSLVAEGKYFLIEYDNKIIGGIMCPITPGRAIYEWYICGEDGQYPGIYPSILATWAPIQYALDHRLKYFDFMGAGKPDQDYGVREFKGKYGGELVEFGRFERINRPLLYKIGKIGLKILGAIKR